MTSTVCAVLCPSAERDTHSTGHVAVVAPVADDDVSSLPAITLV